MRGVLRSSDGTIIDQYHVQYTLHLLYPLFARNFIAKPKKKHSLLARHAGGGGLNSGQSPLASKNKEKIMNVDMYELCYLL